MTVELIRQCAAMGDQCHLVSFDNRGRGNLDAARRLKEVCESISIAPSRWQFDPQAVRHIGRIVAAEGIDVVHSHKYKTTFHALLALRGMDVPLVSTYHNWVGEGLSDRLYESIDRGLVRFVDAAIGVSAEVTTRLEQCSPRGIVRKIENGIDTSAFQPIGSRATAELTVPVLGFVGRLTPKKGVADLLTAAALVAREARFQIQIVGDGPQRGELEQLSASLGLADRVSFLGKRDDMVPLYHQMEVLLLPSYAEGMPMVLLESLSCGIPAICSEIGECPRLVIPGRTGWLHTPGDVSGLATAIRDALRHPEKTRQYGLHGRALVQSEFSSIQMASKYREVYSEAVRARSGHC